MGLLRVMMPPKLQLLALLAFAVAMFFLENQIQKLEESRGKLGKFERLQPHHNPVTAAEAVCQCVKSLSCVNRKLSITPFCAFGSKGGSVPRFTTYAPS